MKTAEEILNEVLVDVEDRPAFFREQDVADLIGQAQKDAYNQAIEDAVNSVKVVNTKKLNFETGKWENTPLIDQTSILKLKK